MPRDRAPVHSIGIRWALADSYGLELDRAAWSWVLLSSGFPTTFPCHGRRPT